MKNNTAKLLVILLILVGVFLAVKFTRDGSRSESYRSALVEIDTSKVTKIEIISPADSTVLHEEGGLWLVGDNKNADQNNVKSLLANLQRIVPSRIASRSKDQWQDFQVNEQGTRVKVYEGASKTLDIILGRFNVEGQRSFYSYVRLEEDEDTYVADNFMKMSIGTGDADYRNDDLLRINKDSLSRIDFDYPDSTFSMYKVNGDWQIEGQPVDSAATVKYINGVTLVTSKNFGDSPSREASGKLVFHQTHRDPIVVSTYGEGRLGSSYNPEEYWEDKNVYDKLFVARSTFTPND